MRVYELARELEVSSKELLELLRAKGIEVKSHSSSISDDDAEIARRELSAPAAEEAGAPAAAEEAAPEEAPEQPRRLTVKFPVTVQQLCEVIDVKPNILIKRLLDNGIFASLNQFLDEETAGVMAADYGYELVSETAVKDKDEAQAAPPPPSPAAPAAAPAARKENLKPRGPVVTLMGHIDHGKTSILDAIRRSRITAKEAGGITQHIGAYRVDAGGHGVVFLDTPGHAAFTTMRARGANLTDIVVLVVAADDGIMPQTLEAIDHARAADVPVVVAINKCDKTAADPNRVKMQLVEKGLAPEGMGGEVLCVEVSATTKKGLSELLEMLLLQAEIMELKADPEGPVEGIVVEAKLSGKRGVVATVLVRNGTLKVGQAVVCGECTGKVKAMFDDRGQPVKAAGPATPVEVLGLNDVPEAGAILRGVENEVQGRRITEELKVSSRRRAQEEARKTTLEDFFQKLAEGHTRDMRILLKGDVQGSVEALGSLLAQLSDSEVALNIIRSDVGDISESDIMLASASDAVVVGFHVGIDTRVRQLARQEGVDVRLYNIIYEAVDEIRLALEGMLSPIVEESVTGEAVVLEVFKISKVGRIAGCRVESGKLRKGAKVRLRREGETVTEDTISQLKRFKDSVEEVTSGQECGIALANFHDFQAGDVLQSIQVTRTARRL